MPPVSLVVLAFSLVGCSASAPSALTEAPSLIRAPAVNALVSPIPASSRQMLLVTTDAWDTTSGRLQRYTRTEAGWEAVGEPVPTVVGRNGLGWGRGLHAAADARRGEPAKREGDGRAPAGVFRLTAAFGYADTEATGLPYLPTDADTECVDDAASASYNTVLERTPASDWTSHEEMRRRDPLYRIGVVVAHNGPGVASGLLPQARGAAPVAGGGSCIFLHVWRTPTTTTSGCTAMPDEALQTVLAWLDAAQEPVLVQLPRPTYARLGAVWALP